VAEWLNGYMAAWLHGYMADWHCDTLALVGGSQHREPLLSTSCCVHGVLCQESRHQCASYSSHAVTCTRTPAAHGLPTSPAANLRGRLSSRQHLLTPARTSHSCYAPPCLQTEQLRKALRWELVPVISDFDPKFNNDQPLWFERLYEPLRQAAGLSGAAGGAGGEADVQ
jgi:hypothetical protein